MGFISDHIRGHNNLRGLAPADQDTTFTDNAKVHSTDSSDSDTLSLEARNEKEVEQHPDCVTADAQIGQKKAEAAALIWGKNTVYCLFAWIWLCFFLLAFQSAVMFAATATAFSLFANAPAYSAATIIANVVAAALFLPIGKTLNLWGRAEGYLAMFALYMLGMIILASANNPNTYAAGYTIFFVGYDTLYNILTIFVADISGLRNRAFAFAFVQTPFIITSFTGSLAGSAFLHRTTWQWAIGAFVIIQPFFFLPLAFAFKYYEKKAKKMGLYLREPSGRTALQSIVHYLIEFDVVGALIFMAALILILLPFSLVSQVQTTYGSATFIAMLVVGLCLVPVFYLWERYFARVHFVRWEFLQQRTVLGAVLAAIFVFLGFYCWDLQFYNYCLVVFNLDYIYAGYMNNIYNVGSTFWGVIFGLWIRWAREFKYTTLLFALPLMLLGDGLAIKFRGFGSDSHIGYVIMCQIFNAFAGGSLVIAWEMAVMAASDRDGIPMALSLMFVATRIGGAFGQAVSTAIMGKVFPDALLSRIPGGNATLAQELYTVGYTAQLKFLPGSPTRDAINYAWGEYMKWANVAGTVSTAIAIPFVMMWKHYRVDKKQNKGTVL